eukprot:TRINITY_DN18174_c0_g1_i1.p1 TRINITY_DN18174_c0_g1~~TRINITY_DN18174_c0_g1_i1.p1  ORF type:complete len:176 (-),score=16.79 TRINITY_DN18174_c0_g1_i1:36-563(-)
MKVVGVLLLLVLVIIISVSCQSSIKFYASISEEDSAVAFVEGVRLAFERVNGRIVRNGHLNNGNLSLDVDYDNGDMEQLENNVRGIMNSSLVLGVIYSNNISTSEIIRKTLDGTTIPFIAPGSGNASLSVPFQRNVINFRPSFTDAILTMIQYVVQSLSKDNFCLYYDQEYYFLS